MQTGRLAVGLTILFLILASPAIIFAEGPIDSTSRAEMRFLEGLIDHSQIAVDMAQDCLTKAHTEAVHKLCRAIADMQAAHIKVMRGWLLVWYQTDYLPHSTSLSMMGMDGMNSDNGDKTPMPMMPTMDAGMMGQGQAACQNAMMPMMMGMNQGRGGDGSPPDPSGVMGVMAGLNKLTGHPYEIAWLEAMVGHDTSVMDLAGHVVKDARHQELRDLAEVVIHEQTAEIKTIQELLTEANAQ